MKILITSEWYSPVINGVVTSIINLKKELQHLGHDVRILTLSNQKKSFRQNEVTYISSLGIGKIYPGARITLSTNDKYLDELIAWQPDVIHTQCEFSTFRLAKYIAKHCGAPIIHTYHTVYEDYTHYFSPNRKWGKAMVAVFTKKVLKHATYVIAPTDKVQSLLKGYGVTQEISVIPTGIYLHQFTKKIQNRTKQQLRQQLGLSPNQRLLLFVGRLAKEKNLEEIIRYFARLNRQNLVLLIVGDGPHRHSLENYANKKNISDRVIFTGMVSPERIATYYQIGDAFVSASNSETQGLTYIEALASGLPAICREDPCLDNVIVNERNGWQYSSYEDFKEKLQWLISDKEVWQQFSKNAVESAVRNFSSTAFAQNIESIYFQAIKEHPKNHDSLPNFNQSSLNS
ncbi:glycosyltransferase family 4 protein [Gracilibacillus dipsosauri]|uniref:glycosyltransferase family 4 protein n=1 Tax=Gracilibacillus dipsosauri TaxID=178340 RepID=UPI0024091AE3